MALSYADAAVVQEQLVLGHANLDVRLLKVWHKSRDAIFDRGALALVSKRHAPLRSSRLLHDEVDKNVRTNNFAQP